MDMTRLVIDSPRRIFSGYNPYRHNTFVSCGKKPTPVAGTGVLRGKQSALWRNDDFSTFNVHLGMPAAWHET